MNFEEERQRLASNEVFGGKLNMGEVSVELFVEWYKYRMAFSPMEANIPLKDFDINSTLLIFEEWVKDP